MKKVLAIDMGATSIRGILGYVENGKLLTQEVMRFSHQIQEERGRMYWDWSGMMEQIVNTIVSYGEEIDSIGVDTWGVDFGALGEDGKLLDRPHSYRDPAFSKGYRAVLEAVPDKELFQQTGTQLMDINTLFQWKTMAMTEPALFEKTRNLLLVPDLINYYLTGEKTAERTISSTTQMLELEQGKWNEELLEKLGLPSACLADFIANHTVIGSTRGSLIPEVSAFDIPVISVAGHDTASAVYVTESYTDPETLFLSSGTWSLMGCFTEKPIMTEEAFQYQLTNETGVGGRNMTFKNITGLYLIERLRDALKKEGEAYSFDEITDMVRETETSLTLNPDHPRLTDESLDFISSLDEVIREQGEEPPSKKTDYFKILYRSLALTYADLRKNLEKVTGRNFHQLHVIGGGSKSLIFNQMIAEALQMPLIAGPAEATALGNIVVQLEALGGGDRGDLRNTVLKDLDRVLIHPGK